ncbi:hypothetical protein [Methylobacterium sp. CM6257]
MTCLASRSIGRPKGDFRGTVYATANLRALDSERLSDGQPLCGGA